MSRADKLMIAGLDALSAKPGPSAKSTVKKRYSELMSAAVAQALAEECRKRGMKGALPAPPGVVGASGAERRMSGGIGAKKVDVSWATEDSGLIFATSVKTINFRDGRTNNFQKNLTNRRGDMLFEAVTLHRRFPYAVLAGFFFLDHEAAADATARRRSTFINAHARFGPFAGREDSEDKEEAYEFLYIVLVNASPFGSTYEIYPVGESTNPVTLDSVFTDILDKITERNPDFYEVNKDRLRRLR